MTFALQFQSSPEFASNALCRNEIHTRELHAFKMGQVRLSEVGAQIIQLYNRAGRFSGMMCCVLCAGHEPQLFSQENGLSKRTFSAAQRMYSENKMAAFVQRAAGYGPAAPQETQICISAGVGHSKLAPLALRSETSICAEAIEASIYRQHRCDCYS